MKCLLFIAIGIILLPAYVHAAVRITEIAWMGVAGTNGQYGEWLELYNDSNDAVDVSGWKLYSGGGSDLVYTLTKSIPAKSYFLVERTTASMPDPVPGINDEAGPFGRGGLSNSGENLVLKDAAGVTLQSLSYGSGWPAGDATTKDTMQWDGSTWVTAPATPHVGYGGVGSGGGDTSVPVSSSGTSQDGRAPRVDPHIAFIVPKLLYSGVSYDFKAVPMLEYTTVAWGFFRWNMGDGEVVEQRQLAPVSHTYTYPGTYVLSFAYFHDSFEKDPVLAGQVVLTVERPALVLKPRDGGVALDITNTDTRVADISGWTLLTNSGSKVLPLMTLLPADATTTLTARALGLQSLSGATLESPDGRALSSSLVAAPQTKTIVVPAIDTGTEASTSVATSTPDDVPALLATPPERNHTKVIIFGVIAFVIIVLSILLERFMAQKE